MFKNLKMVTVVVMCVLVLTSVSLAGCSSNVSQDTSLPSGQQPSTSEQKPSQSGQPGPGQDGQPPSGQMNNEEMLSEVADILGISADELTSAYDQARESLFSGQEPPSGEPPTGEPPTGEPPDGEGQPPAGGPGGGQGGPNMEEMYDEMAEILGISADEIASAFEQAMQSLMSE